MYKGKPIALYIDLQLNRIPDSAFLLFFHQQSLDYIGGGLKDM